MTDFIYYATVISPLLSSCKLVLTVYYGKWVLLTKQADYIYPWRDVEKLEQIGSTKIRPLLHVHLDFERLKFHA